jgi:hypothetical protein
VASVKTRAALLLIWLLCLLASLISAVWMFVAILRGSPRAWRLALAYDRLGNASSGGSDRETISSRADRARSEGRRWGCVLCRLLDRIDPDHCKKSAGV